MGTYLTSSQPFFWKNHVEGCISSEKSREKGGNLGHEQRTKIRIFTTPDGTSFSM